MVSDLSAHDGNDKLPALLPIKIGWLERGDREWLARLLLDDWGGLEMITRGRVHRANELPGLLARMDGQRAGVLLLKPDRDECELVLLQSLVEGVGVGSSLLRAAASMGRSKGWKRLWLITTNDNLPAVRFYLKRGLTIAAIHQDAIKLSRRLKPQIPVLGINDVPIKDEVEMELLL